jgi:hypothetical protein
MVQTLKGTCHGGTIEFEVRSEAGPEGLKRCDCSLCTRKGAIMATALLADLTVTKGTDKLSLYQCNTHVARHYFCSICGIYTHHQRRKNSNEYGYNGACIDLASLGDISMIHGISMSVESNN